MTLIVAILTLLSMPPQVKQRLPDRASISGSVVRADTNAPISRPTILLTRVGGQLSDSITVLGNTDGRFTVRNIQPGTYRVFAGHPDYVRSEFAQRGLNRPGSPIELVVGQDLRDITLTMLPTGIITGRVLDEFNSPISKVYVHALKSNYRQGERELYAVLETQTNDLGEYRLYGLAPGLYFISAAPYAPSRIEGGSYVTPTPPHPDARGEGRASRPLSALLNTGSFVEPMALAGEVYVYNYYPGTTDADSARPLELRPGGVLSGIDLGVARTRGVHVRGRVVDASSGRALQGGPVYCTGRPALATFSTVGAEGNFELVGLTPGRYRVRCATARLGAAVSFEVGGTDIDNLRILLQPLVTVTGRVTIEGRPANDNDPDFSNMRVKLSVSPSDPGIAVQPNGAFQRQDLAVGEYPLSLTGLPSNAFLKSARVGETDVLGAPLRLEPEPGVLEMVVSTNGGSIDALITDDNQRPSAGAIVALVPDQARRKRFDLFRSAIADPTGRVHFEGIPPGDYKIFAWEDIGENAWQDPDILRIHEDRGQAVKIGEGSRLEMRLRVIGP